MTNKELYGVCLNAFEESVKYTNAVSILIEELSKEYGPDPNLATLAVRNEQIRNDQEHILSPLKNKYQIWDW